MITVRKLATLTTVIALALGVFGASAQDDVPDGDVRIAHVGPLTGAAEGIGQELLQWSQLAVDDFNMATGWDVELVEVDTALNADVALENVEAILDNDTIYGAIGPASSTVVGAVAPAFVEAGLVHISSASTFPDLTDPDVNDFPTFFRVVPTDAVQGPTNADYLWFNLGVQNLVIIDDGTDYADGLAESAEARFEENGGTVLFRDSVEQSDVDFSEIVSRIASSDAEAVFFPGQVASQGALLARQLLEQGIDIIFFGADGFNNFDDFIADAAGATEGAYVSVFAPDIRGIDDDLVQDTIEAYIEAYDDSFSSFGPPSYVATQVLLEAMLIDFEDDGELSREGTLEAVSATEFDFTILGTPLSFDENGDVEGASFFIFQVEDGEFVLRGTSSSEDDENNTEDDE